MNIMLLDNNNNFSIFDIYIQNNEAFGKDLSYFSVNMYGIISNLVYSNLKTSKFHFLEAVFID